MANPYLKPSSSAKQGTRPRWQGAPSLARSLDTLWGWFVASWWQIMAICIGVGELGRLLRNGLYPSSDEPWRLLLWSAAEHATYLWTGLIVGGAVIRLVLDREDGVPVTLTQALVFGVGRAPAMLKAVALRVVLVALGLLALGAGSLVVQGRLLSLEAHYALRLPGSPSVGLLTETLAQSRGHTLHLAVLWVFCCTPLIALNVLMFCSPLVVGVMDWPIDWIMLPSRPLSILANLHWALPAMGGLAFALSARHSAGLDTPLFWREDQPLS